MPSRKNSKPPPNFSFVPATFQDRDVSWFKAHSGAARSHAAYWGGPARLQRQSGRPNIGRQNSTIAARTFTGKLFDDEDKSTTEHHPAPKSRHRNSTKTKHTTAISPHMWGTFSQPPTESDNLQHLPPVPFEIKATTLSFAAGSPIFEFCGPRFVKQFLLLDHEDYSIMLSGCLLLSFAHFMALTGRGSKLVLLKLKGQVIRRISAKIASSGGLLSPRCLPAILALGSTIVAMVSQDLPGSLSVWEYINATMRDDYECCRPDFASTTQNILVELTVHRQAMHKLLQRSKANFRDEVSLALLKYISNFVDTSMAIEAANNLHTPLLDVGDLFPATAPCINCSIPAEWASPLTCQWQSGSPTTQGEKEMMLLAGLTNRWLATFVDGDCNLLEPTKQTLDERADLRGQIEGFAPVPKSSTRESAAMYESCRWASSMLLAVEKMGLPIHVAARHVRIRPRLVRRLRMTDLTYLWGIHKGLLFWVTTMCQFATAGQCFPLLCATILARFTQEIAMTSCCSEIAVKPLKRLKMFESLCSSSHLA